MRIYFEYILFESLDIFKIHFLSPSIVILNDDTTCLQFWHLWKLYIKKPGTRAMPGN